MRWSSFKVTQRQVKLSGIFIGSACLLWMGITFGLMLGKQCMPQTPTSSDAIASTTGLSLLSINLQFRPRLLFSNGQSIRAKEMAALMGGYDVLIFSEAFDDYARQTLVNTLRSSYPYVSQTVGSNKGLFQDSGLVVLSRWKIEAETNTEPQYQQLFQCEGARCFNEQGVLSVRINKNGKKYRLLTAQLQTGNSSKARAIRQHQLQLIEDFIQEKKLLNATPMLFAPSLPIAPQTHPEEFQSLINQLGLKAFQSAQASVDPVNNELVSSGIPRSPDIFFTFKSQTKQPVMAQVKVKPLRISQSRGWKSSPWMYWRCRNQNLSDHYALEGIFQYPYSD